MSAVGGVSAVCAGKLLALALMGGSRGRTCLVSDGLVREAARVQLRPCSPRVRHGRGGCGSQCPVRDHGPRLNGRGLISRVSMIRR